MRLSATYTACVLALSAQLAIAADPATDLRRLQQQRGQDQTELSLKMQQQQSRALRPPQNSGADLQRREVERAQLERQRQLHDLETRAGVAPQPAANEGRDKVWQRQDSERAARSSAQQLGGFDSARHVESERAVGPGLPPIDY